MIWEWLIAPIDKDRAHEIGLLISWHARLMMLAWGGILPFAIFAARYLKILPWQNWPKELDNQLWWYIHSFGLAGAYVLGLVGVCLALLASSPYDNLHLYDFHTILGYTLIGLGTIQILLGIFRGTKGGPTDPRSDGSLSGDHYDMTQRRLIFEHLHRCLGYLTLIIAFITILSGMWKVNASRWMWLVFVSWWVVLGCLSIFMQFRGRAFDTYQAIWGPAADLPGNKMKKMGWATMRPSENPPYRNKEKKFVWYSRRHRFRTDRKDL